MSGALRFPNSAHILKGGEEGARAVMICQAPSVSCHQGFSEESECSQLLPTSTEVVVLLAGSAKSSAKFSEAKRKKIIPKEAPICLMPVPKSKEILGFNLCVTEVCATH